MALKTICALVLSQVGLVASLREGDCAFVGVYGDQDDFAVVMMEHVKGEDVFLTEEYPTDDRFKVSKYIKAKDYVSEAKRGTVLKRGDFVTEPTSLMAATSLTLFSGSAAEPTVLCSINMEAQKGVARHLSEESEVPMIMLGLVETAQYAGATHGTKASLLEDITNPSNWIHGAPRQLGAFTIASDHHNTTMMMTTTMKGGMNMTTTMGGMTTTTMMEMTTTAAPARTVVAACTELSGGLESLVDSTDAVSAFSKAIASLASVPETYVQNVVFSVGTSCGAARRLDVRRLQSTGTVNYDLVFPESLGAAGSASAAAAAVQAIEQVDATAVTTALTTEMASFPSLADVSVTVTNVGTFKTTESGGTSPAPMSTTTGIPRAGCHQTGMAASLMLAVIGYCVM